MSDERIPDIRNYRYRQSFCDGRADHERAVRLDALLEAADAALLGQMAEYGDPPDGIVVEVRS